MLLHDEFVVCTAGSLPLSGEYRGPEGFFDLMAKVNRLLTLVPGPILRDTLSHDITAARFRLTFTSSFVLNASPDKKMTRI